MNTLTAGPVGNRLWPLRTPRGFAPTKSPSLFPRLLQACTQKAFAPTEPTVPRLRGRPKPRPRLPSPPHVTKPRRPHLPQKRSLNLNRTYASRQLRRPKLLQRGLPRRPRISLGSQLAQALEL